MSSIDQRIVQMIFDNKQFESGISTTLSSLSALKDGLNFNDQQSNIKSLQGSFDSFNLNNISHSLDDLTDRFTNFKDMVVFKVLDNIADKAVSTGERLVKSLSVDQISAGWSKFESSTRNLVSIANATDKTIEEVEEYNDKLMWYADVTSFDTASMQSALQRFTSSGVDIDTATKAIIGIGNATAFAGKSAKEGSAAFAIWAKAIGSNKLYAKELNSLEAMGAIPAKLKQEFIDAAVALGNLKEGEVTLENFRGSLNQGVTEGWLSKEVMMNVFGTKYGQFTEDVYQFTRATEEETGSVLSLNQALEQMESQNKVIDDFGKRVLEASTLARTFTDAIDAAKDAASSQWAKIFTAIIGGPEEATRVWTDLNDILVTVFAGPVGDLALVFQEWNALGGRNDLLTGLENLWEGVKTLADRIDNAFIKLFGSFKAVELMGITQRFKEYTGIFRDFAKNSYLFTDKKPITIIPELELPHNFVMEDLFKDVINPTATELPKNFVFDETTFGEVFTKYPPLMSRFETALKGIVDAFHLLNDFWDGIKDNAKLLAPALEVVINRILDISAAVGRAISKFREWEYRIGLFQKIFRFFYTNLNNFIVWLLGDGSKLGTLFSALSDNIQKATKYFSDFFRSFKASNLEIFDKIKEKIDSLNISFSDILNVLRYLGGKIKDAFGSIGSAIKNAFSGSNIVEVLDILKSGFVTIFLGKLAGAATTFGFIGEQASALVQKAKDLESISSGDGGFFGMMKSFLSAGWNQFTVSVGDAFTPILNFMKTVANMKAQTQILKSLAIAMGILVAAVVVLSGINPEKLTTSTIALAVCIQMLSKAISKIGGVQGDYKTLAAISTILIPLAAGLLLMSVAARILGKMDIIDLAKGIIALAVSISLITSFLSSAGDMDRKVKSIAKALIPLGIGLILIATAVRLMGSAKIDTVIVGVGALVAMVAALGAVLNVFPKNTLAIAAGIAVLSASLFGIVAATYLIGVMDPAVLGRGLSVLAVGLLAFAAAMKLMDSSIKGALALAIASASLLILVPALLLLSTVDFLSMLGGLAGLAIVIGVLAVAAAGLLVIPGLIPAMIGFAVALALAGVGIVAISAGLASLSTSLAIFITEFVGIFPIIVDLFWAFCRSILVGFIDLVKDVGKALIDAWPTIIDIIGVLLVDSLRLLVDYGPPLCDALVGVLELLLDILVKHIPKIIDIALTLIVAFFDGLALGIEEKGPEILRSMANLFNSIIYLIADLLQGLLKDLPIVGGQIDAWFEARKAELKTEFAPGEGEKIATGFTGGMENGIRNKSGGVIDAWDDLNKDALDQVGDYETKFESSGKNTAGGFIRGLLNRIPDIKSAAMQASTAAYDAFNRDLMINSPSEKTEESGEFFDLGFIEGTENYKGKMTDAMANLGDEVLNSFMLSSAIGDAFTSDLTKDFAITPVIDDSQIMLDAQNIDGYLSTGTYSPSLSTQNFQNQQALEIQKINQRLMDVNDKLANMLALHFRVANQNSPEAFKEAFEGTGVYLDKTKVGKIVALEYANVAKARGI